MVRLRIPRSFSILGRKWIVEERKVIEHDREVRGLCLPGRRKILLQEDLGGYDRLEVFLHEVLHAGFPHGVVGSEKEEQICHALDAALADVVRALVKED